MLYSIKNNSSVDLIPRSCDDPCILIVLLDHIYSFKNLLIRCLLCTAENYCSACLDLIKEELTEVLDIHLSLSNINYCCSTVKSYLNILSGLLDCLDNI